MAIFSYKFHVNSIGQLNMVHIKRVLIKRKTKCKANKMMHYALPW